MIDNQIGHPCSGKDCTFCETCIFDEDLFLDKVQPNKKSKENMERKLCNGCVNVDRSYEYCSDGLFDAVCKVCTFPQVSGTPRPRRIDFNLTPNSDIVCPTWCPLKEKSSQLSLPSPSQVAPSDTTNLTYADKRELMKSLPRHIEWDDIKEGHTYVIPKIMSQSRKIVKVITKTSLVCSCHEISETTGNEYQYLSSIYPTDLDAVFITEMHNF